MWCKIMYTPNSELEVFLYYVISIQKSINRFPKYTGNNYNDFARSRSRSQ